MTVKKPKIAHPGSASDPQFQSLIETALDIMAVLNDDGTIRYLSPSVFRITGYAPEELIGQCAFDYIHDEDAAQQLKVFKATESNPIQSTKGLPHIFRFRHKEGYWVVLESVSNKLPDGIEAPGIVVNARDVTERTQEHESMRQTAESQRRFAKEHEIIAEIGRIISSDLNLEEVFELFAAEVRRLITCDMISASVVDNQNRTTTIKYCSGPEEYREDFQTTVPIEGSFTGQVVASGKPVIIQGPSAHVHVLQTIVHHSGKNHDGRVLSRLGLPMTHRGEIIGALILFSSEPDAFSEWDVAIAERVCYQIAGAINNSELFDDLKTTEAELAITAVERSEVASQNAAIAEIGRIISSTLDISEVFAQFGEVASKLLPCDRIAITSTDLISDETYTILEWGMALPGREPGTRLPLSGSFKEEITDNQISIAPLAHGFIGDTELVRQRDLTNRQQEAGIQSFIYVPLRSNNRITGSLMIHSKEPDIYDDQHVRLLNTIAGQISGAIANSQLYSERTEAERAQRRLAEENAAIAEIGRIISSNLDIDEVYEPFAEQVRKLIDYDVLGIAVVDLEEQSFRVAHRVGDNLLGKSVGSKFPFERTIIGEVVSTGSAKIVQGVSKQYLQKNYPVIVSTYESGVRSWLCVPLVNRGEFVGTILVHSRKKNAFKDSDIEIVERVGNQIAGAINNAGLFDELKITEGELAGSVVERTQVATQNEVIAEIGRIISSTLNIDEIYEPFAEQVHKLIDYDVLSIGLVNERDQTIKIEHRVGDNILGRTRGVVAPLAGTLTGEVYKTRQVAIVQGSPKAEIQKRFPQLIKTYESGVRSWVCVPLVNRGGCVGSLLVISKNERAFTESDVELAQRVGNQIAGAIANVGLFAVLKEAESALAVSVVERTEAATQNEVIAEIGRIIGSALNIEEVYEPFTIQVRKLIQYDILGISVFEPDGMSSRIAHRVGDNLMGKGIGEVVPLEGSISGGGAKVKRAIIVQGISRQALKKIYPVSIPTYDNGVRSWLCVPLINRGELLGTLQVLSKAENAYGDSDIDLAQRVSDQIAGAIGGAETYSNLKRTESELAGNVAERIEAAHQNEVIAEIGRIISSTLNIDEVYEAFSNQVGKLIDSDVLAVGFLEGSSVSGRIAHWSGEQVESVSVGTPVPFEGSLTGEVSKTRETLVVQGISKGELQKRFPNLLRGYRAGMRSWICSPLINRGDFVGSLVLMSKKKNAFSSSDAGLTQRIAHQIAGALDSVRLYSDLERVQTDLVYSNNRNQMILDTAHDAYVGMDDLGQVTAWNSRAEVTFGWSAGEAVRHRLTDLIVPSRFAEQHLQGIKEFLASGERSMMNQRLELVACHRDGHEFPVEMTISPLRLGNRHIFNYFIRDITERQASEDALKRSEEKFRMVYNSAANGMGTRTFDGAIKDVNPAFLEMVGYSADEIKELDPGVLYDTKYFDLEKVLFGKLLQGEEIQPYEKVYIRKDGSEILTEIRPSLERDDEGNPTGIVAVVTDITERQRMEEERARTNETLVKAYQELQEVDRLKDEFISTVSHELRTPITSIKGSAEILLAYDDEDRETQMEFLQIINKECDRLTRLVTDVLDLSRMESRRMRWIWEELDLGEVVSAAVDGAQSLLIKKEMAIKVDLDGDLPLLWNDRDRLAQVVTNLLSNSIKFTPTGGRIWINAKRIAVDELDGQGEKLEISVSDTGIGIHLAEYESIFEKFRQVGGTLSEKPTGTGLGLAICKEIVEYLGGKMRVESTVGKGSTFYFTLPVDPNLRAEETGPELGYLVSS